MKKVVILGTGGTIAGRGNDPARTWSYDAAQLSVDELLESLPSLAGIPLEAQQIAQIDSKDMTWAVWQSLGAALAACQLRDDIAGVVITHGTDTLEETAWLLATLHTGRFPIVLTAAMRPATALDADGPANLTDAVAWVAHAAHQGWCGVSVLMQGQVWQAAHARKSHSHALDAFDGGGEAPLLTCLPGTLRQALKHTKLAEHQEWPVHVAGLGWSVLAQTPPRVLMVTSHADVDGFVVDALMAHAQAQGAPIAGIVVSCTGHGTIHERLVRALECARASGVVVWRSSRTARGGVLSRDEQAWRAVPYLTAAQARLALTLHLMGLNVPL